MSILGFICQQMAQRESWSRSRLGMPLCELFFEVSYETESQDIRVAATQRSRCLLPPVHRCGVERPREHRSSDGWSRRCGETLVRLAIIALSLHFPS